MKKIRTLNKVRIAVIIIASISLISLAISAGVKMNIMTKDLNKDLLNNLPMTQIITSEDSSLISSKYIVKLRSHENVNSKVRNPVSFYYVDDTYHLVIYKIDSVSNMTLPELLQ